MGYLSYIQSGMTIIGGVLTAEVSPAFRRYGRERSLDMDDGFERLVALRERYGSDGQFDVKFDGPGLLNPGFAERYRLVASLFDEGYVLSNYDGCFDTVIGVGPPETIAPLVSDLVAVGGRSFMRHQPGWFKQDMRRYLDASERRSSLLDTLTVMPWTGGVAVK